MTRLKSLYVKNFRSINGEVNISLDAPIVLIHGPNGSGKTSLLSAIELALTGAVPSLSRAEPEYLTYLPHKDRPFGEVRLEVEAEDGVLNSSSLRVTTGKVTGNPLLTAINAKFFSERSYLAQSTLGRLLEIYQHAEKKSDSPLTRFVKELLGLDRMEALIGGLHTAGSIARLRTPVPAYGELRERISQDGAQVLELAKQATDAAAALKTQEADLRQRVAVLDSALVDVPAVELIRRLGGMSEEADLAALVRARREIEVSKASWLIGTSSGRDQVDHGAIETLNQSARNEFEKWNHGHGEAVEGLLQRTAGFFADISASNESSFVVRADVLFDRVSIDLKRIEDVLAAHQTALLRRDSLARQLAEAQTRLSRLEQQLSAASSANEAFARALSELASHIEDDVCPVCDRDYSEVSGKPLSAHVAAKIATMVEQAGRLQALLQSRTSTQGEVTRTDREMQAVSTSLVSEVELTALKSRAADLSEVSRQIGEMKQRFEEGDRLRGRASRAAQALVAFQNADQSSIVMRKGIEDMARNFGITYDDATPTEQLLRELTTTVDQRERALAERQTTRESVVEAARNLVAAREAREEIAGKCSALERKLAASKRQKAEADTIIDLGKEFVRQTREARSRVVRRVFNDELNSVWRDLFVRLAPEEPFIPAFAIPVTANADVEAVLETLHRRGGKGGNPRAMLSAGNLNTAALTLFLALHLSVKPRLPWLVIDDPVQSMDEVHIAQFAALLRTLSKQMRRQVIVAVHERSLFDYLSLELSPAFEGDRLNVVELGRSASGQTTGRWDARLYVADRAIAA